MSGNRPLCPCVFLVPTALNSGEPVPSATMARIHLALVRQFEALTMHDAKGLWQNQAENHICYCIALDESRVEELKAVVKAIGKELGQKQMYFEVGPPSVWLLDIDDDTPPLPS